MKWSDEPFTQDRLADAARGLLAKGVPLERWAEGKRVRHALSVPRLAGAAAATVGPVSACSSLRSLVSSSN